MKIELSVSKEQLEKAIKLIYLGNWVVNSIRGREEMPTIEEYDEISNLFLKLAYENGLQELVSFDKKNNMYFPSDELADDSEILDYLDDFVDDVFWEELSMRLAERDTEEKLGKGNSAAFPTEKEVELLIDNQAKYIKEFGKNGVKNLRIVNEEE